MSLSHDAALTATVRSALGGYIAEQVDDGQRLLCPCRVACRTSVGRRTLVEGQASHVGSHFALRRGDHDLRILVVPKQVGGHLSHGGDRGHEHITIDERGAQVHSAKAGPTPHPRTAHMVGTALALKVLLGFDPDGPEMIEIDGESVHVFECMVMANSTLCSMAGDDASGQGSAVMFLNCKRHLAATIDLVRPTVILAQGYSAGGWSPSRSVAEVLGVALPERNTAISVATGDGDVVFIPARHPARNWTTTSMPEWQRLLPALESARVG